MMRRLMLGLAMLAAAMPAGAIAKDDKLEKRSLPITDTAFDAIRAGQPQRALDLVEPVIADFEKEYAGRRRIYCAETLQESGRYMVAPGSDGGSGQLPSDPAKQESGAYVIMGSVWCKAQYVRAFALVDLRRLDDAQAGFERLIQFAPQRSRYLNELAYVLLQKRQWQASIDVYNRANAAADLLEPADRDSERCVALRGVGYDLVELGRLDDAEAAYRKCLAITPNEPKSLGEIEYINEQRKKTT